jgi:cation transport ATPase
MADPAEWQLQRLEARIDRLEQLVVRGVAALSAVLLLLGVLLDYVSPDAGGAAPGDEDDPDVVVWGNLLTLPFKVFGFRDGDEAAGDAAFAACYLVLLLVTAVALWLLWTIARREAGPRLGRVANVVGGLLVLGTLGALTIALGAASENTEGETGPAIYVFAAGVAVYLVLIATSLRDWWDPARGAVRRGSSLHSTAL